MPESKRPDPRAQRRGRSPAPRPGGGRDGAASGRERPRAVPRREPRAGESRGGPEAEREPGGEPIAAEPIRAEPIRESVAAAARAQSEQRLGSTARRAAVLAAVVCVLTLTIAGPVRTYFAQRTEMNQLAATEAQLRSQISDLEQQKVKLADPVFIAAQARERLGFVMPGDVPFQVQLPASAAVPAVTGAVPVAAPSGDPWYTSLWHTIADAPHGNSPVAPGGPAPVAPGG